MPLVTIEVTAEDAASPHRKDCRECMVGRAARRALPGRKVEIGILYALIDGRLVKVPDEVGEHIERYMKGKTVEPFSFAWEVPEEE